MKTSRKRGTKYSRAEAIDILAQTKLLQESIDALNKQAMRALMRPDLKLVKSDTYDCKNK